MGRTEGPVDPKLAKRRQKNKLASAKCRERKLNRAQFLTQEVQNMKSEVDEKQNKLDTLFESIENYKAFLSKYEDALTEEEKKTLKAMFAPETSQQDDDESIRDTSTEDSISTLRESVQNPEDYTEGTEDDSMEDSDDESYQPQIDDLSSEQVEQVSTSRNIQISN